MGTNQLKGLSFILFIASTSLLIGCGGNLIPETRKVHQAPSSEEETGVIVSGLSEDGIANLLSQNENLTIREINRPHNLYEVFGASVSELKAKINQPDVIVEKNHYVNVKSLQDANPTTALNLPAPESKNALIAAIEQNQHVKLEGEPLLFVSSCKLNRTLAPKISVKDNQGRDKNNAGIFFEIDQSLSLDASNSISALNTKKLSYMWLITPPE
ncbi:MAG: hypothetical protein KDD38_04140, partial [Bdellovibrionales bacterium]|nr:hypothetical protein [Bdellovibrionales bacterium]